jgi:hypothetical protein
MNTQTDWKTVAVIHDPERLKFWQAVLGGDRAPIKSILTISVHVPDDNEGTRQADAYFLDLNAITTEQREKLIKSIAKRFVIPVDEVERAIDDQGVPILAEHVSVSSSDPGSFFSTIDDIDEDDDDDYHSPECTCETCIQNHPERMTYLENWDDE